jgi:hydroxylamine dehydrogenase
MTRCMTMSLCYIVALAGLSRVAAGQTWGLTELSKESKACIECHKKENPAIYQQWGASKHFRGNIGCYECHGAQEGEPDAFKHEGQWMATIVSPKDCARCHGRETQEFAESHHSKGARILGSLDNTLAEIVEGYPGMITPAFETGVAASAVMGCWQCHGA